MTYTKHTHGVFRLGAALSLLAVLFMMGVTGTYGKLIDTLEVTNHISVGDIKIGLTEYALTGTSETAYQDPGLVEPGMEISKIPRISNLALPCWIRARITFTGGDAEILTDENLNSFTEGWIKKGDYYYYTSILKRNTSVDLFRSVTIPADWSEEHSGQELGIVIQAEAVQAANFTPDFDSETPWGDQKIQACIHKADGTLTCRKPQTSLLVKLSKSAKKLMSVPDDFFVNLGTAMPGDVLQDTIAIDNNSQKEVELFFRTSTEGRTEEQLSMLKDVALTIEMGGQKLFSGTLDSDALETEHSLGIYAAGSSGEMKFTIEIPASWDNDYARKETDVTWIFSCSEDEEEKNSKTSEENPNTENNPDNNSSNSSAPVTQTSYTAQANSVKTGDDSNAGANVALMVVCLIVIAVLGIIRGVFRSLYRKAEKKVEKGLTDKILEMLMKESDKNAKKNKKKE